MTPKPPEGYRILTQEEMGPKFPPGTLNYTGLSFWSPVSYLHPMGHQFFAVPDAARSEPTDSEMKERLMAALRLAATRFDTLNETGFAIDCIDAIKSAMKANPEAEG